MNNFEMKWYLTEFKIIAENETSYFLTMLIIKEFMYECWKIYYDVKTIAYLAFFFLREVTRYYNKHFCYLFYFIYLFASK